MRGPDGALSYGELDATANRVAHGLRALGVRPGDRVALWVEKSARTVAAMQGVLRAGAAYVPLDPMGPALRARAIAGDAGVRAIVTSASRAEALRGEELAGTPCLAVDGPPEGPGMAWSALESFPARDPTGVPEAGAGDLAYVLYTSGSTGRPKGVCLSHGNALAFVEWAAREVGVAPEDRLSAHAPFHFDLSVFDLYAAFLGGASSCLVSEGVSYSAARLVEFLRAERITVTYLVPSALVVMMEHGGLLDGAGAESGTAGAGAGAEADAGALRAVLFAGEVFAVRHLRRLRRAWPGVRLLNLYGPTETNVCTFHEVHEVPEGRTQPVPIGRACAGDRVWAVRPDGTEAGPGEEGELLVEGPTVMLGYWGQPPQEGPYWTGDVVRRTAEGDWEFVGRRDHLVKVRGQRVELGEIEAALLGRGDLAEAAVTVAGEGPEARLVGWAVPAVGARAPALLEVKRHLAERLPRYMIVDELRVLSEMPRTSNGKIDRVRLAAAAAGAGGEGEVHGPG